MPIPTISDAELEVMKVLWRDSPLTAAEVVAQLVHPGWSDRTVKSLLSRLLKKGALVHTEQANRYLYGPAITEDQYWNQAGQRFADKVVDGKVFPVLVHFLGKTRLEKSEIEELRKLLDEQEAR